MQQPSGFTPARLTAITVGLVLMVTFVLAYHQIVQRSIRNHPECALRVVREHCRFMLGKQLGSIPKEELEERFRRCDDIRVKTIEASGGVFDPVMIRVTVAEPPPPPVDKTEFIFKSADIGPKGLNFLTSLDRLSSGKWEFNSSTTYSKTTFHGSF